MPIIDLKDSKGDVRWIHVMPFHTLEAARSYVRHSLDPFRIIRVNENLFWVCQPEDAEWAVQCGYKETTVE